MHPDEIAARIRKHFESGLNPFLASANDEGLVSVRKGTDEAIQNFYAQVSAKTASQLEKVSGECSQLRERSTETASQLETVFGEECSQLRDASAKSTSELQKVSREYAQLSEDVTVLQDDKERLQADCDALDEENVALRTEIEARDEHIEALQEDQVGYRRGAACRSLYTTSIDQGRSSSTVDEDAIDIHLWDLVKEEAIHHADPAKSLPPRL
ncbi:uncharacterized protein RCC_04132 [Ramularia collo-cygni]|uniref:Uncharacterized protein n=1 Tax=Ramularia collo-cygni TaxID=112498 RepID=A0A2D3UTH7_9PEZI|nr:uncharacterized protein RCC_04132 [Ramularia collo-cygni]CZT18288.1 uncharacterized protein RCC_04132 [Ramularia collo-cygni]